MDPPRRHRRQQAAAESTSGQIAAVDSDLAFAVTGDAAQVDAAAYIDNIARIGGTTALYDLDSRNDALLLQSPPNAGTLNTVGPFGVTVDAQRNIHFDIFTPQGNVDDSIADDLAFAVLTRPDDPHGGPLGAYLRYRVRLDNGQIVDGALAGPDATPYDFTGGFAINPIPEPGTWALMGLGLLALGLERRGRS